MTTLLERVEEIERRLAVLETRRGHGKAFTPPTPEEAQRYFGGVGAGGDRHLHFMAHYEKVGWRSGRTKLSDWKAAARLWILRDKDDGKFVPLKARGVIVKAGPPSLF